MIPSLGPEISGIALLIKASLHKIYLLAIGDVGSIINRADKITEAALRTIGPVRD
jgi:hypothetical protein